MSDRTLEGKLKLDALTSIRFFAAMSVVFFHVGLTALSGLSIRVAHFFETGYAAVGLFYVLSGFVLAYNYFGRNTLLADFYRARFARIYPLYAVALILALPTFVLQFHAGVFSGPRFLSGLLLTPTMLQAWMPRLAQDWNGPAWSLSVEAFFYLACPFLLRGLRNRTGPQLLLTTAYMFPLALLPSVLYGWANPDGLGWMVGLNHHKFTLAQEAGWLGVVNFFPPFRLPEFVAGLALGGLFHQRSRVGKRLSPHLSSAGVLAALAVVVPVWTMGAVRIPYALVHNGLLLPAWCLLVYCLAQPPKWLSFLAHPALLMLGEASYGIYILQQPISTCFKAAILFLRHERLSGHYPTLSLLFAYCLFLCTISMVGYQYMERPLRAYLRKRITPADCTATVNHG